MEKFKQRLREEIHKQILDGIYSEEEGKVILKGFVGTSAEITKFVVGELNEYHKAVDTAIEEINNAIDNAPLDFPTSRERLQWLRRINESITMLKKVKEELS